MRVLALIFFFMMSGFAKAETVQAAPEVKSEWESSAELSVTLTAGNTEIANIGLGAETKFEPKPWIFKGKGAYLINSELGNKKAESLTLEARAERMLTESLGVFAQFPYFQNVFAGFQARYGVDAGVAYALLESGAHKITTEAGFGFLREERTAGAAETFGTLRAAAIYKWKLSATSDLESQLSFIDNLNNTADWRLSSQTSVSAVLTSLFSLKVSFKVDHLNTPVAGKKPTDLTTTAAIVAKF